MPIERRLLAQIPYPAEEWPTATCTVGLPKQHVSSFLSPLRAWGRRPGTTCICVHAKTDKNRSPIIFSPIASWNAFMHAVVSIHLSIGPPICLSIYKICLSTDLTYAASNSFIQPPPPAAPAVPHGGTPCFSKGQKAAWLKEPKARAMFKLNCSLLGT